jgi:radical SAM superfamily enzyme YgiQ (UPF0313 family)
LVRVAESRPDLIGLSAVSHSADLVAAVVAFFRRAAPGVLIVVGGPVATADPAGVLRATGADFAVAGEGEEALPAIVDALAAGRIPRGIPGLVTREDGSVVHAPNAPLTVTLDELPFTAWDRVDFARYAKFISATLRRSPHGVLMTSRGCPWNCIFCNNVFGRRFRGRSPGNVLEEIRVLRDRHGIRRVEVVDDIFNLDKTRATEILARMRDELPDVGIGFCTGLRLDLIDDAFMALLGSMNCYYLGIPIETASPRLQRLSRKKLDLDKARRVVDLCRRHRIYCVGFFLVGFPTETPQEVEATFRLARTIGTSCSFVSFISPYEGTAIRAELGITEQSLDMNLDGRMAFDPRVAETYSRMRIAHFRREFLKPRNWFIVVNLFRWRVWWIEWGRIGRYVAAALRDVVSRKRSSSSGFLTDDHRATIGAIRASLLPEEP